MFEPFAWPAAAMITAIVFMAMFRVPLVRMLDRTTKVGADGLQAQAPVSSTEQKALPPHVDSSAHIAFLESYQSPLVLETETLLEEEMEARRLTDPATAIAALRKSLANTLIALQFEQTNAVIFTSQLEALTYLNSERTAVDETALRPFYDAAGRRDPEFLKFVAFGDWLKFMMSQALAVRSDSAIQITVRGHEFLKWRVDQRKNVPVWG